ncbi:MAG: LysR family transcriptional regulator [Coprobacillaceae bacterium]
MDFKQLTSFIAVYEHHGFTNAANVLGYAQSTITTQIKLLEEELGAVLFERIGKNVYLTEEGKKFLTYSKKVLSMEKDIKNNLLDTQEISGHLVLGASESLCNHTIPKLLKRYRELYPNVTIEVKITNAKTLKQMLRNNEIDVMYTIGYQIQESDMISHKILDEKLVFAVPMNHPLANKNEVTLKQISKYPLLLTTNTSIYRNFLNDVAQKQNISLHHVVETENIYALKQFVLSDIGIAFLPSSTIKDSLSVKTGKLVMLNWRESPKGIITQIIYHKDKHISKALQNLLSLFPINKDLFENIK